MATEMTSAPLNATHAPLDRRLHDRLGALADVDANDLAMPAERVPAGAWLLGIAAILPGVNVVRSLKHITVSGLSLVLGLAALLAAFSRIWRTDVLEPGVGVVHFDHVRPYHE
jgi:hypothetical protein